MGRTTHSAGYSTTFFLVPPKQKSLTDTTTSTALERTWLAYNRTANTLASHGVIVSQLFFLREGHKEIGRVCAIIMVSGAINLELIGASRYLVQSRGLLEADPDKSRYGRAIVANLSFLHQGRLRIEHAMVDVMVSVSDIEMLA